MSRLRVFAPKAISYGMFRSSDPGSGTGASTNRRTAGELPRGCPLRNRRTASADSRRSQPASGPEHSGGAAPSRLLCNRLGPTLP